jgi:hypothetical protein
MPYANWRAFFKNLRDHGVNALEATVRTYVVQMMDSNARPAALGMTQDDLDREEGIIVNNNPTYPEAAPLAALQMSQEEIAVENARILERRSKLSLSMQEEDGKRRRAEDLALRGASDRAFAALWDRLGADVRLAVEADSGYEAAKNGTDAAAGAKYGRDGFALYAIVRKLYSGAAVGDTLEDVERRNAIRAAVIGFTMEKRKGGVLEPPAEYMTRFNEAVAAAKDVGIDFSDLELASAFLHGLNRHSYGKWLDDTKQQRKTAASMLPEGAVQAPITLKLAYKMASDYYEHQMTEHAARAGAGAHSASAFTTTASAEGAYLKERAGTSEDLEDGEVDEEHAFVASGGPRRGRPGPIVRDAKNNAKDSEASCSNCKDFAEQKFGLPRNHPDVVERARGHWYWECPIKCPDGSGRLWRSEYSQKKARERDDPETKGAGTGTGQKAAKKAGAGSPTKPTYEQRRTAELHSFTAGTSEGLKKTLTAAIRGGVAGAGNDIKKPTAYFNGASACGAGEVGVSAGVTPPSRGPQNLSHAQSVTQVWGGAHMGTPYDPAAAVASPQGVPAHVLSVGLHPDDIARRLAGGSGVPLTQCVTQVWGGAHMGTPSSATTPGLSPVDGALGPATIASQSPTVPGPAAIRNGSSPLGPCAPYGEYTVFGHPKHYSSVSSAPPGLASGAMCTPPYGSQSCHSLWPQSPYSGSYGVGVRPTWRLSHIITALCFVM